MNMKYRIIIMAIALAASSFYGVHASANNPSKNHPKVDAGVQTHNLVRHTVPVDENQARTQVSMNRDSLKISFQQQMKELIRKLRKAPDKASKRAIVDQIRQLRKSQRNMLLGKH